MQRALIKLASSLWVVFKYVGTASGQTAALNDTVASLQAFGSPVMVPLFGQADHWFTVTQITATVLAPGSFSILNVKGFDGGPIGGIDSGGNSYVSGLQSFSGNVWKNVFFLVVTSINPSCDFAPGGCGAPPVSDPFFGKYVLIFDPPASAVLPHVDAIFEKSPGIVPAGHNAMNAHLAQKRLWDALGSAGIAKDPQIWNAISGGVGGPASLVNGVQADGNLWDYYLVPILANANTAIAFAELSADDGSFAHIQVPTKPVPFSPVSKTKAAQLASALLRHGETLTDGKLTWDPRSGSRLARSPSFPYYEFGILDESGTKAVIRVTLLDGTVVRSR